MNNTIVSSEPQTLLSLLSIQRAFFGYPQVSDINITQKRKNIRYLHTIKTHNNYLSRLKRNYDTSREY